MDADQIKLTHALLLQESQQLHDNIQRNLNDMQKLLSLVFPILASVFALAMQGTLGSTFKPGLVYPVFSLLMSFLVVIFNNIWSQLLTFTRYKYAVTLPELYRLTGRAGENYGQFTTRGGTFKSMVAVAITQAMLLSVAVVTTYQVLQDYGSPMLAGASCIALLLALGTTIAGWALARHGVLDIRKSAAGNQSR